MIRSLRRLHLRTVVVLAVLVTVLFVLAIRNRPQPPPLAPPGDLPAATQEAGAPASAAAPRAVDSASTTESAEGTDGP